MFKKLLHGLKEWRRKREWNAELQLYHLRVEVLSGARWMAHNPIVAELTARYLRMLADDWEKQPREDVSSFRSRIGLDPNKHPSAAPKDNPDFDKGMATRLRRVCRLLGIESQVPDDDETLHGAMFAVLGQIARALERTDGSHSAANPDHEPWATNVHGRKLYPLGTIGEGQEPVFWVRPRSDGGYDTPLRHEFIEQSRKESGAWVPLFRHPQPAPDVAAMQAKLDKLEAVHAKRCESLSNALIRCDEQQARIAEIERQAGAAARQHNADVSALEVKLFQRTREKAALRILLGSEEDEFVSAAISDARHFEKQRDKLLSALEAARTTLERENQREGGPICDTIWHGDAETLFDFMDSAIAKAKGGAA